MTSQRDSRDASDEHTQEGAVPDGFYEYYARESASDQTRQRFEAIRQAVLRVRERGGAEVTGLDVADIGCNAGTQCILWAHGGHRVHGVDINEQLLALGRSRGEKAGLKIDFRVGSATALPWDDSSMDVCLLPELLEHVEEWEQCIDEAVRILKSGGTLFLSTTNRLCPKQEEFDLPLYSWYPRRLKRHYERLSRTSRPELVNHAEFPAVHWFTFFELAEALAERGLESLDRFDIIKTDDRSFLVRGSVGLLKRVPLLRWLGHVATPYTVIVATKQAAEAK